ncbi:MAG: DUF6291 domain-containing protein [Clostridia bacterium]|nr:DUF6291 domain-containing protein [Clostridia bacterium]
MKTKKMSDTERGFLFFYDWLPAFRQLSGEDFKCLFLAMIDYQRDGTEPPEFEGVANVIGLFVFPQLERRKQYVENGINSRKNAVPAPETAQEAGQITDRTSYRATAPTSGRTSGHTTAPASGPSLLPHQDKDQKQDKDKNKTADEPQTTPAAAGGGARVNGGSAAVSAVPGVPSVSEIPSVTASFAAAGGGVDGGIADGENFIEMSEDTAAVPPRLTDDRKKTEKSGVSRIAVSSESAESSEIADSADSADSAEKCGNNAGTASEPDFDVFWARYPKHTARTEAKRIFEGLSLDAEQFGELLRLVDEWSGSPEWAREDGRFISRADTFLEDTFKGRRRPPSLCREHARGHAATFDVDEFFKAALRRSYAGAELPPIP